MDFAEVLTRAWQIIWRHKVLWIFGILSGCANSGRGLSNFNFDYKGHVPLDVERFFKAIPEWQLVTYIGIAALILLVIVVLAIFLGTLGRIGLIRGARQSDQDMEARLSFGELFRSSFPYFWRVFLLNLLVGLVIITVVVVLAILAVLGSVMTLGIGLVCVLPLLCLLIPLACYISLVVKQSNIAIVVEDLSVLDGLRHGWEVVRSNVGTMIVMWLILALGVKLIGGFILSLPMILSLSPIIISSLSGAGEPSKTSLTISIICVAVYMPFLILLSGILQSYIETTWTLTFLRVTRGTTSNTVVQSPKTHPEPTENV